MLATVETITEPLTAMDAAQRAILTAIAELNNEATADAICKRAQRLTGQAVALSDFRQMLPDLEERALIRSYAMPVALTAYTVTPAGLDLLDACCRGYLQLDCR